VTGERAVGVGIVGAGQAGVQHLDALSCCPEAAAVTLWDSDAARLSRAIAARRDGPCPAPEPASSLRGLLSDDRVRIVALATPPGTHAELAMTALTAGRAVLLEKPPLLTSADLELVCAEAERRGLAAGVMLQHRFRLPAAARAPWSPDAIAAVEVVRYRPPAHYGRDPWRTNPAASGGGLIAHLGIHYLDLACHLLGSPADITGTADLLPGTGLDQRVMFTARFGQGARLAFAGTTAVDAHAERIAVYDADRVLTVEGNATSYTAGETRERLTASTAELRARVYSDMAAAVRDGRPPDVAGLRSAVGVVRLLELIGGLPGARVPS
jgi:predicted dehydrogenase